MTNLEYFQFAKQQFIANNQEKYGTEEIIDTFHKLSDYFLETNSHMNLTAIKDEKLVVTRHFVDCIMVADLIPTGSTVIDIGSGGGMPSIPLAIVRPDIKITALDATQKKVDYINSVAKMLNLDNLTAISGRAEELSHTKLRETYDIAIARAVAELRVLIEWCVPYIRPQGYFIAMKGRNGQLEFESAKNAIKALDLVLESEKYDQLIDFDGQVSDRSTFVFKKAKKNSPIYPRKNTQISKKPL